MPPPAEAEAIRRAYWAQGYRPVPINNGKKYPTQLRWTELARRDPPYICTVAASRHAPGTGILCDGLRAIDIDIERPEVVAEIVAWCLDRFGEAPLRERSTSARVLMLYRAAEGEPRKARAKNSVSGEAVEVLGHGQQCFSDGWHPSGAYLMWTRGPDMWSREDLNPVDEDGVAALLAYVAELIAADIINHPGREPTTPPTPRPARTGHRGALAGAGGGDWCLGDIRAALDAIPNRHRDWDTWWKVCAAVHAASGGSIEGFRAFANWSAQNDADRSDFTASTWAGLNATPPDRISAGSLVWLARQHQPGWEKPSTSAFNELTFLRR